jgi:hypothetical protein
VWLTDSLRLRWFPTFLDCGFRNAKERLHRARELFQRWLAFDWLALHAFIVTRLLLDWESFDDGSPVLKRTVANNTFARLRMAVQPFSSILKHLWIRFPAGSKASIGAFVLVTDCYQVAHQIKRNGLTSRPWQLMRRSGIVFVWFACAGFVIEYRLFVTNVLKHS